MTAREILVAHRQELINVDQNVVLNHILEDLVRESQAITYINRLT